MLTGIESSAERSEALLLFDKMGSDPSKAPGGLAQMLGKSEQPPELRPHPLSAGKSIRSSMWSKKLPQSISSMKSYPIISFLTFLRNRQKMPR